MKVRRYMHPKPRWSEMDGRDLVRLGSNVNMQSSTRNSSPLRRLIRMQIQRQPQPHHHQQHRHERIPLSGSPPQPYSRVVVAVAVHKTQTRTLSPPSTSESDRPGTNSLRTRDAVAKVNGSVPELAYRLPRKGYLVNHDGDSLLPFSRGESAASFVVDQSPRCTFGEYTRLYRLTHAHAWSVMTSPDQRICISQGRANTTECSKGRPISRREGRKGNRSQPHHHTPPSQTPLSSSSHFHSSTILQQTYLTPPAPQPRVANIPSTQGPVISRRSFPFAVTRACPGRPADVATHTYTHTRWLELHVRRRSRMRRVRSFRALLCALPAW